MFSTSSIGYKFASPKSLGFYDNKHIITLLPRRLVQAARQAITQSIGYHRENDTDVTEGGVLWGTHLKY
jgi:hypothetical protein